MVQLQTFTKSGYVLKNNCFDYDKLQNLKKKWEKLSNSFEISKNIISKFSGRLLIGQNDSLDVLLLDAFFLQFKKGPGRYDLTHTFGG